MPGLLAQRCGGLEADERKNREHHPLEDAAPVAHGVARVERLRVQVAGIGDHHPDRERAEDGDLECPRITPAVVERRTSRYVSRKTTTVINSTQIHHCPE